VTRNGIARSPIIIIGMHRSGTSLVSRFLEELGLFIGKKKDENHEALFFRNMNTWLLRQCGGAWDNPESIQFLLNNIQIRELVLDYLQHVITSPHTVSYMGWGNYLQYRSLTRLTMPWGWKDPRNTFSLPIWRELFPKAKVIHICRHGVDVANSLLVRQRRTLERAQCLHSQRKALRLYWLHLKRNRFTETPRVSSLQGGFSLWETYLVQARTQIGQLGSKALEVRYEDFLAEPTVQLASLARFCNLDVDKEAIATCIDKVQADRAYAYRQSQTLQEFADEVSERLRAAGY
jgi:hypothetical protein